MPNGPQTAHLDSIRQMHINQSVSLVIEVGPLLNFFLPYMCAGEMLITCRRVFCRRQQISQSELAIYAETTKNRHSQDELIDIAGY